MDEDIELLKIPMIAIVCSRAVSFGGLQNTSFFAQALAKAGLMVLSRLARGIDWAAHHAILGLPNSTALAVCGTGVDMGYLRSI